MSKIYSRLWSDCHKVSGNIPPTRSSMAAQAEREAFGAEAAAVRWRWLISMLTWRFGFNRNQLVGWASSIISQIVGEICLPGGADLRPHVSGCIKTRVVYSLHPVSLLMVKRFNIRLKPRLHWGHLGFRTCDINYITHSQNVGSFSWTREHGSTKSMNGASYLQTRKLIRIIRKWSLTARPLYTPDKNWGKNRGAGIVWIFGGRQSGLALRGERFDW